MNIIVEHPEATGAAVFFLIGVVGYLYKTNTGKDAALIASKLDNIAEKFDVLFARDEKRSADIMCIKTALAKQVQRCDDRENNCPGKQAVHSLSKQAERQIKESEKARIYGGD